MKDNKSEIYSMNQKSSYDDNKSKSKDINQEYKSSLRRSRKKWDKPDESKELRSISYIVPKSSQNMNQIV